MDSLPSGRSATQREIASETGLSLATVSRALADNPRVRPETRARVSAAAKKLGYRPKPGFDALIRSRWGDASAGFSRIAVLFTGDPEQRAFTLNLVTKTNRLPERAHAHGMELAMVELTRHPTASRLAKHLRFLNASGVIIPLLPDMPPWAVEVLQDFPCVGLGCSSLNPPFPLVEPDDLHAGYECFNRVHAYGYRRIGMVQEYWEPSRGCLARKGGLLAAQEERIPLVEERLPILQWRESHLDILRAYIERYEPDALIGFSSLTLSSLQALGCAVPEDIGYAAIASWVPDCSGIHHDRYIFMDRGLNLLRALMRQNIPARNIIYLREEVRFNWQEGSTLRAQT